MHVQPDGLDGQRGDGVPMIPDNVLNVLYEVGDEVERSQVWPALNSAHEGYAVLLEEVDELWDHVKTKRRDISAMRKEAIQVAAVAVRFALEICREDIGRR